MNYKELKWKKTDFLEFNTKNMCGIIGVISPNKDLVRNVTRSLLDESQIRGKHATGISFISDEGLITIKEPIEASKFILPETINNILIGHVRYSTSDINYNQPLQEGDISLVHNGVITQAPFNEWEDLYGYKNFNTRNDSEILLKRIASKVDMSDWFNFENSSIAAGCIINGELMAFRNGQRPLYIFNALEQELAGFASTENIIKRAIKFPIEIIKTEPGKIYNIRLNYTNTIELNVIHNQKETKDLQFNTIRGWHYLKGASISY